MASPIDSREEEAALQFVLETARRYLAELDESPVLPARGERFGDRLPEDGDGAVRLHQQRLVRAHRPSCVQS